MLALAAYRQGDCSKEEELLFKGTPQKWYKVVCSKFADGPVSGGDEPESMREVESLHGRCATGRAGVAAQEVHDEPRSRWSQPRSSSEEV